MAVMLFPSCARRDITGAILHTFRLVAGVSILLGNRLSIEDIHIAQDLLDNLYKTIIDSYGTVAIKIKMLQVTLGNTLSPHAPTSHTHNAIHTLTCYMHMYMHFVYT